MKIQMQYPDIKGNKIYDGKTHTIKPKTLSQIENFELYLLDYFDEDYSCDCSTILIKNETIQNIPLLNYDLLYDMIEEEKLNLTPVDIFEIIIKQENSTICLASAALQRPPRDIMSILRQVRKVIIIYIDDQGKLWINVGNGYERINSKQLLAIMQRYDIEWRNKTDNSLATQEKIDIVLSIYLGQPDGFVIKEKYNSENIHHYSIERYYENKIENIKGNFKGKKK